MEELVPFFSDLWEITREEYKFGTKQLISRAVGKATTRLGLVRKLGEALVADAKKEGYEDIDHTDISHGEDNRPEKILLDARILGEKYVKYVAEVVPQPPGGLARHADYQSVREVEHLKLESQFTSK